MRSFLVILLVSLSSAADGRAQEERGGPAPGDEDAAAHESLLQLGEALLQSGNLASACPKLEQAVSVAPSGRGALLLADCFDRQGKTASAWAAYRQAAGMLGDEGRAEEAERAKARSVELEPKVSKLTVVPAAELSGMEVLRGGVSFGAGIFGVPVAIDPGKHRIEVRAPGHRPWSAQVAIRGDGDRVVVAVPPLKELRPRAAPRRPTPQRRAPSSPLVPAGIVATGSGVAAIVVGAVLGAVAARDVKRAESDPFLCGNAEKRCSTEGYALIERADDYALGSTITIAIGAAAALAGVTLLTVDALRGRVEASARGLSWHATF